MSVTRLDDHQRFDADRMVKVPIVDSPFFFCDVYCLEPGQEQPVHEHADSDKLYYVLEGQATVTIGDATHQAPAGTSGVRGPPGTTSVSGRRCRTSPTSPRWVPGPRRSSWGSSRRPTSRCRG